ncbi:hypothetical protein [Streptomyces mayteni]
MSIVETIDGQGKEDSFDLDIREIEDADAAEGFLLTTTITTVTIKQKRSS